MANRRPNPRLAKIYRNYTVDEVARLFRVHRNTVRAWIKAGLATNDNRRPILILGRDLAAFLLARQQRNRRACKPGQIYCVRCRIPQNPDGGVADYEPQTVSLGCLVGICPSCDCLIYRRVNPAKLEQVRGNLEVRLPQVRERIDESARRSVNSDFGKGSIDHGNSQRQ